MTQQSAHMLRLSVSKTPSGPEWTVNQMSDGMGEAPEEVRIGLTGRSYSANFGMCADG